MRRKPKENNFKVSVHLGSRALPSYSLSGQPSLPPHLQAVLETIRDLMNAECVVPDWLHDVFLGYGDPAAAHYNRCEALAQHIKWLILFPPPTFILPGCPAHSAHWISTTHSCLSTTSRPRSHSTKLRCVFCQNTHILHGCSCTNVSPPTSSSVLLMTPASKCLHSG